MLEENERPRLSDFQTRVQSEFEVTTSEGRPVGSWLLSSVEPIVKPEGHPFADLESFTLFFESGSGKAVGQGSYVLRQGEFAAVLFAVPESSERMVVTVN